jgi:hypothetical protein
MGLRRPPRRRAGIHMTDRFSGAVGVDLNDGSGGSNASDRPHTAFSWIQNFRL